MQVTKWKDWAGKTVDRVVPYFLGGYIVYFADGDYSHVVGAGEELHGTHWPDLAENEPEYLDEETYETQS